MNTKEQEIDQLVDDLDARDIKERRVLTALAEKYSQQKGKVFALRSEMGFTLEETGQRIKVPSFVIVQSLNWVGKEIKMGSEMPFMQNYLDKDGKLKINDSNAESVKQRQPDWTRQPAIAAYLAHDKRRKFGTILAVMNPTWIDDPTSPNWGPGPEPRALRSAYQFKPIDSKGQFGMLDLDEYLLYALDGQHRVMGIRGIQELIDKGLLEFRSAEGVPKKGKLITKQEFMTQFHIEISELQSLLQETITVELIPAVLANERMKDASQRVRSVFLTINGYQQKTGKSETTLLDESDGFAMVGRKAGTLHDLFKDDRVNWKGGNLPQRTRWYTTLETLKKMATSYLSFVEPKLVGPWQRLFKDQVPIRPEEEEIEQAKDVFFDFLNRMEHLPVFEGLASGDDLDEVRLFPGWDPKDKNRRADGHLLTRPLGQEILAYGVGSLVKDHSLDEIFTKLAKWDEKGGFQQHDPGSIWYGVTYDFNGDKMSTRTDPERAAGLLRYMIQGAKEDERKELLKYVVEARGSMKHNKPVWVNFKGEEEPYDAEEPWKGKHLPRPID
jgi:hypothetical protein